MVGNGTPQSCTEAALDARLAGGGAVTFNAARNGASNRTYGGVGYVSRAAGSDPLWTTLSLANGAFIEGIDAFFNDNSAASTGRLFLTRFFGTNSFEDIASAATTGDPGFTTLTIDITAPTCP